MNQQEITKLMQAIWNYLVINDPLEKSDAIFVFGGIDLNIPKKAAEIYKQNLAPIILITGGKGPYSNFDDSEAQAFKDELLNLKIPENSIILEENATNAKENVIFGIQKLEEYDINPKTLIIVARDFMLRRCKATFNKLYPNINIICCPTSVNLLDFYHGSLEDYARRLIGEIERLEKYGNQGDLVKQEVPDQVKIAVQELKKLIS